MKNLFRALTTFALVLCMCVLVYAAEDTVYLDGTYEGTSTGTKEAPYTDLKTAVSALPNGGTVIVCGDTTLGTSSAGVELSAVGGKVTVTSENSAVLTLARSLTINSEVEFDNITLCNASSGNGNIILNGNPVTFGEGVTVTSTVDRYPNIIGGAAGGTFSKGSSITVKGGTFRAIYGGNYAGTFNGNSEVNILGGTVTYAVVGGSLNGNFTGNATLNIGGNATIPYASTNIGIIGGTMGNSSATATAYTFTGDIKVNYFGDAEIYANTYALSRYNNITTTGNLTLTVYGNAKLNRQTYAGGYYGNTGAGSTISVILKDNATVNGSKFVCAGAYKGNITGDCSVEILDNAKVTGAVFAGCYEGNVTGNTSLTLNGGTVTSTFSSLCRTGTVSGTSTTLLKSGTVDGEVRGDEISVDTSDKTNVTVSSDLALKSLIGGGSITVPSSASISAETHEGEIELLLSGTPEANKVYLTVADTASEGTVKYTSADKALVREVGTDAITYTLKYEDRYESVKVRVYYYNPNGESETQPKIVMYKGLSSADDKEKITLTTGTENGKNYVEATVTPGLHYYKVYYGSGGSDYAIKYFYVTGKVDSLTFDAPYELYKENDYMEPYSAVQTDEVMAYFGTEGLVGYNGFDTPTFTKENYASYRSFMTNKELCEYVNALDKKCAYLYVFYPFNESTMGNKTPIMLFTNDTIPEGATLDEAAKIVRAQGEREILMITGGVHGNEPAGPEGVLTFANDLAGDYGKDVLDSFGAIVIMPAVSTDNLQRFKRMTADGINPNRDLMALDLASTQNQVYVYSRFMPTVTIDCHEDAGNVTVDENDYSVENMDDVMIRYSGLQNSPLHDVAKLANGTESVMNQTGITVMMNAIEKARESGVRSSVYYSGTCNPVTSTDYPSARGSYGFIVEVSRIWTNKARYERAVFSMNTGIKAIVSQVVASNGQMAEDVYAGRNAAAAITDFDENRVFATKTSQSGTATVSAPRPSIYVDGTYKDENATKTFKLFDTVSNLRALPTAYVIPGDEEHIDDILNLLDMHGIPYTRLKAGSKMMLRAYSGLDSAATTAAAIEIGDAKEVTLENGGYAVSLNSSDAYLIAYLFEPDSFPYTSAENTKISLAHMGFLSGDDTLYRSEVDDVATIISSLEYNESDPIVAVQTTDGGCYGPSRDDFESGILVFNALWENYSKYTGTDFEIGFFFYTTTASDDATLSLQNVSLTDFDGNFYGMVTNIPKASFDTLVYALPYVITDDNKVYYGDAVLAKVSNFTKWLGYEQ